MFSDQLKIARKKAGLTQVKLSKLLNVSNGTVAMWETGKREPCFEMLLKISDTLCVDIASLLCSDPVSQKEATLHKIGELQDYLETTSDAGEREETEASIAMLQESYDDLCLIADLGLASKKEPATVSGGEFNGLERELIDVLLQLSHDDRIRVQDFASGLIAARRKVRV